MYYIVYLEVSKKWFQDKKYTKDLTRGNITLFLNFLQRHKIYRLMIYIIEQIGKPTILEINKTIYLVSFEHTFIYFKLPFTLLENTNK